MGYANDPMIYAVIPRPLSRLQVMESLNQNLTANDSWCLKWYMYMRLNHRKLKFMVVSWSRINALGYGDLIIDGADLEEVKTLRVLGVTLDSKLTFEAHLREFVPKPARSPGFLRCAGKKKVI